MLCVAHTPILLFVFLTSTGKNRGFKVEASPRPQPVIFRSFLFGYDLNKWGTNGEPLRRSEFCEFKNTKRRVFLRRRRWSL